MATTLEKSNFSGRTALYWLVAIVVLFAFISLATDGDKRSDSYSSPAPATDTRTDR